MYNIYVYMYNCSLYLDIVNYLNIQKFDPGRVFEIPVHLHCCVIQHSHDYIIAYIFTEYYSVYLTRVFYVHPFIHMYNVQPFLLCVKLMLIDSFCIWSIWHSLFISAWWIRNWLLLLFNTCGKNTKKSSSQEISTTTKLPAGSTENCIATNATPSPALSTITVEATADAGRNQ